MQSQKAIHDKRLLGRLEKLLDLSLRAFLPDQPYDTYRPNHRQDQDKLFSIMLHILAPSNAGDLEREPNVSESRMVTAVDLGSPARSWSHFATEGRINRAATPEAQL